MSSNNINNENTDGFISLASPTVNSIHPRQEIVTIEKRDLKHYIDAIENVSKVKIPLYSIFSAIFTFCLGNLSQILLFNTSGQEVSICWIIVFSIGLGGGACGAVLSFIGHKTNRNPIILAQETNEIYKKKMEG